MILAIFLRQKKISKVAVHGQNMSKKGPFVRGYRWFSVIFIQIYHLSIMKLPCTTIQGYGYGF
jgi:hypothetical protein